MSEKEHINKKNWKKRLVIIAWVIFLLLFVGLPIYIHSVKADWFGLFGGMPSLAQLENPENDLSSTLYYADGEQMGKYFRSNRSQVGFNDLSPELITTLVTSEDHRFFNHSGLDLIGGIISPCFQKRHYPVDHRVSGSIHRCVFYRKSVDRNDLFARWLRPAFL